MKKSKIYRNLRPSQIQNGIGWSQKRHFFSSLLGVWNKRLAVMRMDDTIIDRIVFSGINELEELYQQ
jgi:hypothetical protein